MRDPYSCLGAYVGEKRAKLVGLGVWGLGVFGVSSGLAFREVQD